MHVTNEFGVDRHQTLGRTDMCGICTVYPLTQRESGVLRSSRRLEFFTLPSAVYYGAGGHISGNRCAQSTRPWTRKYYVEGGGGPKHSGCCRFLSYAFISFSWSIAAFSIYPCCFLSSSCPVLLMPLLAPALT
jgi:hypothetical protein